MKRIDNGTNNIKIQGKTSLISIVYWSAKDNWFSSSDDEVRDMMEKISIYYANKVGIQGKVDIDNSRSKPDDYAHFDPNTKIIYTVLVDGFWNKGMEDAYNYMSTLEHENFHKQDDKNNLLVNYTCHAKVYVNQFESKTFGLTTMKFQIGQIRNMINYLENAKEKKEAGWENLIAEFNKTNAAGYTINNRDSGGMQLFNKDGKATTSTSKETNKPKLIRLSLILIVLGLSCNSCGSKSNFS
ncbi:MAG: hypothetical protein IPP29_05780 [Bacteroidetes bacterium]|nr:hypothetical protein [Bacteroidota bacterium]